MKSNYSIPSKPLIFVALSFLTLSTNTAQNDSSGIYNTVVNYQQHQLSYAINYKTQKYKINDDLLLNGNVIKITHDGVKHILLKIDTYGYRNTKGQDFRFIDNKEYKILNSGEPLLIYTYQNPSRAHKQSYPYPMEYFFSIDASSIPQHVTKANLKSAYLQNHRFHDELDSQIKDEKDLPLFDNFHNTYKIVRILRNSKA